MINKKILLKSGNLDLKNFNSYDQVSRKMSLNAPVCTSVFCHLFHKMAYFVFVHLS